MTPSRSYLLRALHEWILDNDSTPHIVVDATINDVMVPERFISDGQIVLNISPSAVEGLSLSNEAIEFNARFGGVRMHVYVPILAVMAVYAKESGEGMGFGFEPGIPNPDDLEPPPPDKPKEPGTVSSITDRSKRPILKVVK
ncbi:MAG: ClpXP protease specificity-enhancing factor [Gammaproteobacteria bacterium]|nr:ClpXP protease specificity-enhancing factor [Gammaproteobacteria bacterium]